LFNDTPSLKTLCVNILLEWGKQHATGCRGFSRIRRRGVLGPYIASHHSKNAVCGADV
jgi:hypothetical protein